MKPNIANTKNVLALTSAYDVLEQQGAGMEIGLVHGLTGYGKTWAVNHLVDKKNALYLESSPNWSSLSLLEDLCFELGLEPDHRNTRVLERVVVRQLREVKRAIFLDEFDRVLNSPNSRRLIETIRMIHDQTGIPILLVGEDRAEPRLTKHPQFDRRVSQRVKFQPLSLEDAQEIVFTCCDVQVADDLLEALVKDVSGNTAFFSMNLQKIEVHAKGAGLSLISLKDWGKRDFVTAQRRNGGRL